MDSATKATFYEGIVLYNRGKYLECQEPFEKAYRSVATGDQPLIRGLIALACGMHLYFNYGGGRGAENLFQRSLIEIDGFRPRHLGVEVDDLIEALQSYLDNLRERHSSGVGFFDRWLVPRIRYRMA